MTEYGSIRRWPPNSFSTPLDKTSSCHEIFLIHYLISEALEHFHIPVTLENPLRRPNYASRVGQASTPSIYWSSQFKMNRPRETVP